jgi:DNA-directed RNA polymerase specialized sigma24 family protein
MITRTHIDKGVATLATLWGVQPNNVAERLAISLDFSHLTPAKISYRATRALRSHNHKHHLKKHRAKKVKPLNPQTAELLSNPKFFNSLRSKLLKYAKSKIKYTPDAEDLVSDTLLTACTYPASSQQHLTAIALNTLKKALSSYFYKHYNSPTSITPHEDFYILEETLPTSPEPHDPEPQTSEPTSNVLEAFKRIAAELIHQLGIQHAASSLGICQHTLSTTLAL